MRAILVRTRKIELSGTEKATIQTNKGAFVIELFSEDAPNTVVNFIRLAESGFYDGLIWHRYVPDFVIQGGDPTGTGSGNPGYSIDFEANDRTHEEGAVGMARSMDINSASCQFYVCLEPCHGLDGSYCVFGKTIEGMEVVQQLRAGDSIIKISVHK
ncbi:peptidylprolyl isomerase [candidate division WOR-3 bacterium]|nr:peptidylprolyl isomerase [candidate division WOR-3 bacterium]